MDTVGLADSFTCTFALHAGTLQCYNDTDFAANQTGIWTIALTRYVGMEI